MSREERSPAQPNIILVTTDQQRFDTFGPWAPPFLRTPHLNFLAREGVTFARAYAEGPLCVPARASIMTGQSPFRHGLIGNGVTSEHFGSQNTLPTLLGAAGYQTIAIGKMHFGPQRVRHGFQEMLILDDYYREMARGCSPLQPMRHGLGQNELVAAAGGAVPPDVDGIDLLGVLHGDERIERRYLFGVSDATFHDRDRPDFLAVTDGRHKYMWYPEGSWEQLFDLEADPHELHDLADNPAHAPQRDALRDVLIAQMRRVAPQYVADGKLLSVPPQQRRASEARSLGNPGFLAELTPTDVRH